MKTRFWSGRSFAGLAFAAFVGPAAGFAESHNTGPTLGLELNTAETVENACRLTFLVQNDLGADLAGYVVETVVFTKDGVVDRLTLFDFQNIPAARPRVRQFDLAGTPCNAVGSLLFNGAATCDGDGIADGGCDAGLLATSRTDIEVSG